MPPALLQVNLRITEILRARLQEAAEAGGRTFQGEVAHRLEKSFETDALIQRLAAAAEQDRDTIRKLSLALAARPGEIEAAVRTVVRDAWERTMKAKGESVYEQLLKGELPEAAGENGPDGEDEK